MRCSAWLELWSQRQMSARLEARRAFVLSVSSACSLSKQRAVWDLAFGGQRDGKMQ